MSGDTIVTPADLRVTQTIYDSLGRGVETRRLAGVGISLAPDSVAGSTVPIYVTTYTGPSGSALVAAIRSRSETIYDAQGQVAQTKEYDTTAPDPVNTLLQSTTYAYDADGRQTAVTVDTDGNPATPADQQVTSYEYDALGVSVP